MATTTTSRAPAVIGLVSIVAGAIFLVAGAVTWGLVSSNLRAEEITVSEDAAMFGGQTVQDPFTAFAQADIINHHALAATDGKTYAELGSEISTLKADGAADDSEEVLALQGQRTTVMNASFLRASLFTSVVAFGVAALVMGLGVMFALVGLGLRKVAVTSSPEASAAPAGPAGPPTRD
ncbi:aromatic ring-opening dioxygenase LigA [Serinibacter arcticus]|uniref:Aromatic ring-opening dioxygenase LigA n=1 Tax=Serinibacter arcticus TaxID=1655435 RepID=A0A2U1ZQZ8_9MICO|nr:aromatic ring-opening dioxygenase LigA [Serinibacter arcticus]PWD49424.1 aromatic ring-opening dioxygenase LigA [Serinibacter arcticus]